MPRRIDPNQQDLFLVPRCFGWVATRLCGQLQVEFPGDEVDDGLEVSDRAIASCLGLGGLDQTVDSLDEDIGNLAVVPAQDAVPVTHDGVCRVDDGLEPAVGGPEIPFLETRPPPRYNEGTLIEAMQNAWRFVDDEVLRERLKEAKGIGTPATRAEIIGGLKKQGFLTAQGKHIVPTEAGLSLFGVLKQ